MNVLAITAHPDDAEIFMYGLLSIFKKKQNNIDVIIATDGSAGGSQKGQALAKTRANETIKGLSKLTKPIFLNHPDGRLYDNANIFDSLSDCVKKINPDVVITHSPYDYHTDHRTLSKLTAEIIDFRCPILFCDTLMGLNFTPEFFIDISCEFEEKRKAILNHKSQNPIRFVNAIELNNKFRAAQCNAPLGKYAEAYNTYKSFPYFNVSKIIPNLMKIKPFNIVYKNNDSLI